jgi:DNA polymerase-3 subunit beta
MKFSCQKEDFLKSIQNVQRAIQPNNTLPILNNVLIRAEGKKVILTGTNLEIAIESYFDADIENEGAFTIPIKILSSYVTLLSNEEIKIKLEGEGFLAIKQGNSETKIKGIPIDEFPLIPKIEKDVKVEVKADELKEMISQVGFAASTNQSRPVLMGILFEISGDTIKQAATDSYRLAERRLNIGEKIEKDIKIIIPSKTLLELSKVISGSSKVNIMIGKNQIVFEWENFKLISRLIEGMFPNYESIIPKTSSVKVVTKRDELLIALRKIAIFAVEKNGSIQMSATNDGILNIFTEKTLTGECKEKIKSEINGSNTKTSINANYLIDVLQNISTEQIHIEMGEKLTPILIKPLNKDDYINIIMPLV